MTGPLNACCLYLQINHLIGLLIDVHVACPNDFVSQLCQLQEVDHVLVSSLTPIITSFFQFPLLCRRDLLVPTKSLKEF